MKPSTTFLWIFYTLVACYSALVSSHLTAASNTKNTNSATQTLEVWSWNIWFDDDSGTYRYPAILKTLEQHQPDVVFLQEVTDAFLTAFSSSQLNGHYHLNQTNNSGYRNLTLTKVKAKTNLDLVLPSFYGRRALITQIDSEIGELQLINVHLDSGLKDTAQRLKQIALIEQSLIKQTDHAPVPTVFAGDFNFGNDAPETQHLAKHWLDTAMISAQSHKVTYDVDHNPLAKRTKFWSESSRRLDRIYLNHTFPFDALDYQVASQLNMEGRSIETGARPIPPLSDHHPVILNISIPHSIKAQSH